MEVEFDKEIDAILRKTRDARGVLVGDDPPEPKKHLDADTIAAFAEGALPGGAKLLYTEHFADCDPCRRRLSEVIKMDREADAAAASTIWPPVEKVVQPWYSWLFRTPSLARKFLHRSAISTLNKFPSRRKGPTVRCNPGQARKSTDVRQSGGMTDKAME